MSASNLVIEIVMQGLVNGAIYSGLALALVLAYQTTGVINFAQGEMAMLSTYVCLTLINLGIPYWISFAVMVVLSFAFGMVVERVLVRPLAGKDHLIEVIALMGLLVFILSCAGFIWSYSVRAFPSPFPSAPRRLLGHYFRSHDLGSLAVILILLLLVFLFFRYTKFGLAMKSASQNPQSSRLCGIKVSRMLSAGWGMSAAVGAVAGVMVAPTVFLEPFMMENVLLFAFSAALLGGISSPLGAVLGGFAIGIGESLLLALCPPYVAQLKTTIALVLIVAVLTIRPQGLTGRRHVTRV